MPLFGTTNTHVAGDRAGLLLNLLPCRPHLIAAPKDPVVSNLASPHHGR